MPVEMQSLIRDVNELLVLSSLREGAKHGYQIALDVEADSRGMFSFQHGTLYPILHRLEKAGLVAGRWSTGQGRRRKEYQLTGRGRDALDGRARSLDTVVTNLLQVIRGAEPEAS
ncbi:PadR family transcriptional regulator [Gaopeijia maritima]|uniref:PadR family transcriptional regulator n=1 Tax=Gaopeijia maritima TaxID=3119007 RepID=A0ABU9EDL4_9BACT